MNHLNHVRAGTFRALQPLLVIASLLSVLAMTPSAEAQILDAVLKFEKNMRLLKKTFEQRWQPKVLLYPLTKRAFLAVSAPQC